MFLFLLLLWGHDRVLSRVAVSLVFLLVFVSHNLACAVSLLLKSHCAHPVLLVLLPHSVSWSETQMTGSPFIWEGGNSFSLLAWSSDPSVKFALPASDEACGRRHERQEATEGGAQLAKEHPALHALLSMAPWGVALGCFSLGKEAVLRSSYCLAKPGFRPRVSCRGSFPSYCSLFLDFCCMILKWKWVYSGTILVKTK